MFPVVHNSLSLAFPDHLAADADAWFSRFHARPVNLILH